ncbi:MAG: zinc ribbon domain-containing protein [Clostridia bacterium]|nr:zinc ribbon domain-containing protein [Clostridia bacterium]
MGKSYTGNFTINADMSQIKALLNDRAFASQLNIELKSENVTETGVWYRFHHGVSFSSWGEKITITLTPTQEKGIKLDILSECGMPTQIFDMGKNKSNVNAIVKYINENVMKYSVIEPSISTPIIEEPKTEEVAVDIEPKEKTPVAISEPAPLPELKKELEKAPETPLQERAIFCSKCGRRFEEEANFCAKCGNKR